MKRMVMRLVSGPGSRFIATMGILFGISATAGFAQSPIPANDDDIENVITKIQKFTSLAQRCASNECPGFDCRTAQKTFNNLRDARKYLRNTHFWLSRLAETSMEQFQSLANEGKLTSERLAKVQTIVAYQEYVTNIAGTMLDIASASVSLRDLAKNATKLDDMSGRELLDNLDTLYEGIKDFESADRAIKSGAKGESVSRPSRFSLGSGELDNYKSTLSDLKTMVQEAYKAGKDWRKAFSSKNGRAALGAIVGRVSKAYAQSEIEARKQLITNLANDLKASDFAQSGAFDNMQRIRERRNKAEDAFNALDRLLVIRSGESGGTLTRCFQKRKNSCPLFDLNYVSKLRIEKAYEIFDPRDPDGGRNKISGGALRFYNEKLLTEVPNLLNSVPDLTDSVKPGLRIAKNTFEPGEAIRVRFTAPQCFRASSWVGVVPANVSHGDEDLNMRKRIGLMKFLRKKESGELVFKAPQKAGSYELRMNNAGTRLEVRSIGFSVESNPPDVDISVSTSKKRYADDEKIEVNYSVKLKGELQRRQWAMTLAKASSGVQERLAHRFSVGIPKIGRQSFGKLKAGSYEIRILLIVPAASYVGNTFEDRVLARTRFEVGAEEETSVSVLREDEASTVRVPAGWAKGVLYNSNDGACSIRGKYLIFENSQGGRFMDLKSGLMRSKMIVAPGANLKVALTPVRGAMIRVWQSDSATDINASVERIAFASMSNLVNGWWVAAGCKDGTHPPKACNDGKGGGSCRAKYEFEY